MTAINPRTKNLFCFLGGCVLMLVVVFGLLFFAANKQKLAELTNPIIPIETSATVAPAPQPVPHSMQIGRGSLTVNAHAYTYYPLTVPPNASQATIKGHFDAAGGRGNDVVVLILNQDEFVNFKNRHAVQTLYNSGQVTTGEIAADLQPGSTYYLVFDNIFSPITPKAVTMTADLNFVQ